MVKRTEIHEREDGTHWQRTWSPDRRKPQKEIPKTLAELATQTHGDPSMESNSHSTPSTMTESTSFSRADSSGHDDGLATSIGEKSAVGALASIFLRGMKMKRKMLSLNTRRASHPCDSCEGRWHAVISPRNNHIHIRCDGECGLILME